MFPPEVAPVDTPQTTPRPRVNSVINGDCLEVLREMRPEAVPLTVFSPPYDAIRDYNKEWVFDIAALGKEVFRITKDGGMCAVVIGDGTKDFAKSLTSFRLAIDWCDNAGFRLFENCIYQRDGNPGAWWNQRFRVDHEYILLFLKGKRPRTFHKEPLMIPSKHAGKIYTGTDRLTNGEMRRIEPKAVNPLKCRGTVWKYATSNSEGNRLKMKHPATYPDKLVEDILLCFSDPGDLVLDPMCGSGTTCVVAAQNERRFVGIEINPDYCAIARERLQAETGQMSLLAREKAATYSVAEPEEIFL
ncbi:MAG: site-specific DNA-methyltransferase [Armatimonadetes bacterium]|nr:site-specific DNA-methyltransferase [Armatimonadota bacterium]